MQFDSHTSTTSHSQYFFQTQISTFRRAFISFFGHIETKMPKVDHQVSCGLVGKLKFKWDFIMVIATIILEART